MKHLVVPLTRAGSSAQLTATLHDQTDKLPACQRRPAVLIFPGGGYAFCSEREGDPVALAFAGAGYNAFVLTYSTGPQARHPQPLLEASCAVWEMRINNAAWGIDPAKITVLGFSAGGHLAACLGTMWQDELITKWTDVPPGQNRPNALVLCYPVITGGEYRHNGSFQILLGNDKNLYPALSAEAHVNARTTPPAFIWTTTHDTTVSPMNSLLFAQAMESQKIPYELHLFEGGGHGLSLATWQTGRPAKGADQWLDLCLAWLRGRFGEIGK